MKKKMVNKKGVTLKFIELDEDAGEQECDYCKGSGFGKNSNEYTCPKCKGIGVLNWIELVFGKSESSEEISNDLLDKLLTVDIESIDKDIKIVRKNCRIFQKDLRSILGK